jgi:GNAT superfamily N-acetyltransferase
MDGSEPEYFGNSDQQRLQMRANYLWKLVRDIPDYACHGRVVGLANYSEHNLEQQIALARLQGVAPVDGMLREHLAKRRAGLEDAGLVTDVYDHWQGSVATFEAADAILANRGLPADLKACAVTADTSVEDLANLDSLTQNCDVLLPMGSFLRGLERPSVFLYAKDPEGRVVGAAGAVAQFHDEHDKGGMVWWGMLSTDPKRRGEGIALILGAMVLRDVRQKWGFSECFTGIRAGNLPSEALCSKLALARTNTVDLLAINPESFGAGQMTK